MRRVERGETYVVVSGQDVLRRTRDSPPIFILICEKIESSLKKIAYKNSSVDDSLLSFWIRSVP